MKTTKKTLTQVYSNADDARTPKEQAILDREAKAHAARLLPKLHRKGRVNGSRYRP